jgi:hypothetical protein
MKRLLISAFTLLALAIASPFIANGWIEAVKRNHDYQVQLVQEKAAADYQASIELGKAQDRIVKEYLHDPVGYRERHGIADGSSQAQEIRQLAIDRFWAYYNRAPTPYELGEGGGMPFVGPYGRFLDSPIGRFADIP